MSESVEMSNLSARARKLLHRLQQGKWYPTYDKRTPKAMQELIDAGKVSVCGRPAVIISCYVPATGYTPFEMDKFAAIESTQRRRGPKAPSVVS